MRTDELRSVDGWGIGTAISRAGDVSDVTVGGDGLVYVLTRLPSAVVVLDPHGRELRRWGESLRRPHGITEFDGLVYCVDEADHTVRVFDRTGRPIHVLGTPGVASDTGHDPSLPRFRDRVESITRSGGPFNRPTKVAVTQDGRVFVSDGYGNARVHEFDGSGQYQRSWGMPGGDPGGFRVPHGPNAHGDRLLVADRENDRIQVFDSDGTLVDVWGGLRRPASIAVTPQGTYVVAEFPYPDGFEGWTGDSRPSPAAVSELDASGQVIRRLVEPAPGQGFLAPHGLAVDRDGSVYVGEVVASTEAAAPKAKAGYRTVHKLVRGS